VDVFGAEIKVITGARQSFYEEMIEKEILMSPAVEEGEEPTSPLF